MHKEDCKENCEHDHKCDCCEHCECCKEQKLGVVDEALGESCDDGDQIDNPCPPGTAQCQTCNRFCQWSAAFESRCDDGNRLTEFCEYGQRSCQVCSPFCQSEAESVSYCGDGILQFETSWLEESGETTNYSEPCDGSEECTDNSTLYTPCASTQNCPDINWV